MDGFIANPNMVKHDNKLGNGTLVFSKALERCVPMTPAEIEAIAAKHNMPDTMVPKYVGDREMMRRSMGQVTGPLSREGIMVRQITSNKTGAVWGIVQETKDQKDLRLDHSFEDRIEWSSEKDNGNHVLGKHRIAQDIDAVYQQRRGKIEPGDWSPYISQYLLINLGASDIRGNGQIFYILPAFMQDLRSLAAYLNEVGIGLVTSDVETEAKEVLREVASETLDGQLEALQDEVAAFTGKERPATLKAQIELYEMLKVRATMYNEVLGMGKERAEAILNELQQTCESFLNLQTQKPAVSKLADLASQGEEAVVKALENGSISMKNLPEQW